MRIQGDLASYELSDLLQWLAQGRKTGRLTVRRSDGEERSIWFQSGMIALSGSSDPEERLDRYLLRQGLIDADTAERALRLQEATQMLPGQILVTLGAISEEELARVMRLKTEEAVCQLLTSSDGEFTFSGDPLPESSMVPLRIEVANLLLRSMERLDTERRARETGEIETAAAPQEGSADDNRPAAVAPEPAALEPTPELPPAVVAPIAPVRQPPEIASPDTGGLALAEVMDPEAAASRRSDGPSLGGAPGPVAQSTPRPVWQRLLPAAVAAVLVIVLSIAYMLLRNGEPARATDLEGAVHFTATRAWEPPVEAAGIAPSAARAEPDATATSDDPEARLRGDYESRLARMREELLEARRTAAERQEALEALRLADDVGQATAGGGVQPSPPPGTMAAAATAFATPTENAAASAAEDPPPSRAATASQAAPPDGRAPGVASPAADSAAAVPLAAQREQAGPRAVAEQSPVTQAAAPDQASASPAESAFVPPRVLRRARAAYPAAARRIGREATVTVRVLVDETGRASEAQPGPEVGFGFDQAALAAARRTRWEPATLGGEPVESWVEMRFVFTP